MIFPPRKVKEWAVLGNQLFWKAEVHSCLGTMVVVGGGRDGADVTLVGVMENLRLLESLL